LLKERERERDRDSSATLKTPFPLLQASWGRRAPPVVILEIDLYRSLILDEFVTTGCLPFAGEKNDTIAFEEEYKINVAAGWGSIDSRKGNIGVVVFLLPGYNS
jgi:hypothetical protein